MKQKDIVIIISEKLKPNEELIINAAFKGKAIKQFKKIEDVDNSSFLEDNLFIVIATSNPISISGVLKRINTDSTQFKILRPLLCHDKDISLKIQKEIIISNLYLSQNLSLRSLTKHLISESINDQTTKTSYERIFDKYKTEYFQAFISYSYILNYRCSDSINKYLEHSLSQSRNDPEFYNINLELIKLTCENQNLHDNISDTIYVNIFEEDADLNMELLLITSIIIFKLENKSYSFKMLVPSFLILVSMFDLELKYLTTIEKLLNSSPAISRSLNIKYALSISTIFSNDKFQKFLLENNNESKSKVEKLYDNIFEKTKILVNFAISQNLNTRLFRMYAFQSIAKAFNSDSHVKVDCKNPFWKSYYALENYQDQDLESLFSELN